MFVALRRRRSCSLSAHRFPGLRRSQLGRAVILALALILWSGIASAQSDSENEQPDLATQFQPVGEHANLDGEELVFPDMNKYDPGLYAVFDTYYGFIVAELFEERVPINTLNFAQLSTGRRPWRDPDTGEFVTRPLYENITFHRVIPYFMIQSGDPTGKGNHNCGFVVQDEIRPDLKFNKAGRLAMANLGGPGTAGCQFFITETKKENLNGLYTIFGQVLDGMDVVKRISRVIVEKNDKPARPIMLNKVHIIRRIKEQKK